MKEFFSVLSYIGGLVIGLIILGLFLSGAFGVAMAVAAKRRGLTLDELKGRGERDYRDGY